jgi:hypothetical protein
VEKDDDESFPTSGRGWAARYAGAAGDAGEADAITCSNITCNCTIDDAGFPGCLDDAD